MAWWNRNNDNKDDGPLTPKPAKSASKTHEPVTEQAPAPAPAPEQAAPAPAPDMATSAVVQQPQKAWYVRAFNRAASFVGEAIYQAFRWTLFLPFWGPTALGWKATKAVAKSDMSWGRKAILTPLTAVSALGFAATFYIAAAGVISYSVGYGALKASDSIIPASESAQDGSVDRTGRKTIKGSFLLAPFCHTWEIKLQRGTVETDRNGALSNQFSVTVRQFTPFGWGSDEEPEAIKIVEQARKQGKNVIAHYKETHFDDDRFSDEPQGILNSIFSCIQKSDRVLVPTENAPYGIQVIDAPVATGQDSSIPFVAPSQPQIQPN